VRARRSVGDLRIGPSFILTGGPMLAWQIVFFLGAGILLILMTFWAVQNYRLVADYNFENWTSILSSKLFYTIYFRTLMYATVAALLATVLAFPLSYALAFKSSPRMQRVAFMLLILPYFTNYYVRSYSWRFMLEDEGIINSALSVFGLSLAGFQGSFAPTLVGYLGYFFPLVALVQLLSLMYISRDYVEAAHNLGAGRLRMLVTVIIPMARSGLILGFAFGFMLAMGDYIAPSYLGSGGRPTLSILIINTIQGQSDFPRASVISVLMILTLMAVFFVAFRFAFPPKGTVR
jgi:spermidine/putrescine transport system permease protein